MCTLDFQQILSSLSGAAVGDPLVVCRTAFACEEANQNRSRTPEVAVYEVHHLDRSNRIGMVTGDTCARKCRETYADCADALVVQCARQSNFFDIFPESVTS